MDGAVDYEGLTDMLAGSVIQNHFGVPVDKSTRARIAVVVPVYSKSKADAWPWEEDAKQKEAEATPEIRQASATFFANTYTELQEHELDLVLGL